MTQTLFIFFAGYYTAVALLYTSLILLRQRDGVPRVHPGERFSPHWRNHMTFRIFRVTIWLTTLAIAISPDLRVFYVPFSDSFSPPLAMTGVILMISGLALALFANYTLATQWRSGVDNDSPAVLVKSGLYRVTRNPGYIGVGLGQIGFFIAYPSLFTLVCVLIGMRALYRQVLFEEAHLKQRFKETFTHYARHTPRFLPLPSWWSH